VDVGGDAESRHDFDEFSQDVEKKVQEIGTRMTQGDIAPRPYIRGPKSPCKHCKFKGFCGGC